MIDKLQFDYRRNDTERVRAVTTIAAPSTHCPSGHPDKLKFEQQFRLVGTADLQGVFTH